jgi:phenylalanyl-tRNA synthetase alpha chain
LVELRENELKTLLAVQKLGGKADIDQIVLSSGLAHAAVMRAALTLSGNKLIRINEKKQTIIALNKEGKNYAEKGLPERRLINALLKQEKPISIENIAANIGLEKPLLSIALGWLRKKGWATITEKEKPVLMVDERFLGRRRKGRLIVKEEMQEPEWPERSADEILLQLLNEQGQVSTEAFDKQLQDAVDMLKRRKLIEINEKTAREVSLTELGWERVKKGIKPVEEISQLTPELVITGKWKTVKLRKFDVATLGPAIYPGKLHPLRQIIQRARQIFLEMGFTEIQGSIVETAFWNFDALFQPQDHPAREMADTFYLAYPQKGGLPAKGIVEKVAKTHENGWVTGSNGWGGKWSAEVAKSLVLRTHTTSETIKYLSEHKTPPVKVFSVDRVYRNEKVDYRHLAEFHHIEGVVMANNLTLRDLMGTLREFYRKFGLARVQFWPSYFPYTEPSVQATVYVPRLKVWIELCGMGMFRPEVLAPLSIKYPVLAWGGGLERLALLELGLDDLRLLYKNGLSWIRRTPVCL